MTRRTIAAVDDVARNGVATRTQRGTDRSSACTDPFVLTEGDSTSLLLPRVPYRLFKDCLTTRFNNALSRLATIWLFQTVAKKKCFSRLYVRKKVGMPESRHLLQ